MAKQTLPPYFTGTAGLLTFYKLHGKYYARAKSSLTAERVLNDACFAPTRYQASVMARASRIGAIAYAAIPAFCRTYKHYRLLTGKANLLLKKGLHEDEILLRLIEKYIVPLRRKAITDAHKEHRHAEKRKRKRSNKPSWLRGFRRLKMAEWGISPGAVSAIPLEAVDSLLNAILQGLPAETSPPAAR